MSEELLSVERELAGIVQLSELAGPILNRLQRLIGASGSTLSSYGAGDARTQRKPMLCGGTLPHMMLEYPPELFAQDPIYSWNLAIPPSTFIATGEMFDLGTFARGRPYLEFYRPMEIGFMCGVRPTGLPYGSQHMFSLMFCTPRIEQRFAAKELNKLRHLEAPLRSAARRIARFRALEHKSDILYQLIDRQNAALVVWDVDGRLVWSSAAAQRQLEGSVARAELEHAAARAIQQLRRRSRHADASLLGRPCQLRSGRGAPLLVEFSWFTSADRPWLLAELRLNAGLDKLLGTLTNSETRILSLIAAGLSNGEIAGRLVVSRETVKTHVKHILSKLGVSSRGKAAGIAREAWERVPGTVLLDPSKGAN